MANEVHYQAQQAGRANWLPVGAILFHVRTDFAYKQWYQKVQETQSGLTQRLKTNKTQYIQVAVIPCSKQVSLFKQLILTSNLKRIPFTSNIFLLQEEGSLLTTLALKKGSAHSEQEHRVPPTAFLPFFYYDTCGICKRSPHLQEGSGCAECKPGLEKNVHPHIQVMGNTGASLESMRKCCA